MRATLITVIKFPIESIFKKFWLELIGKRITLPGHFGPGVEGFESVKDNLGKLDPNTRFG